MKKLKIVSLLICVLLTLSACSFDFGDNSDSENKPSKPTVDTVTITVIDGDYSFTQELTCGEEANIGSLTKMGYYLTGYFTQEVGGEKYFTTNGDSVSVWQKNFPTTFYAQWDSISNSACYFTGFVDEPLVAKTSLAWHNSYFYIYTTFHEKFLNAIQGNLEATLYFTISYRQKLHHADGSGKNTLACYITEDVSGGGETIGKISYTASTEYQDFSFNFSAKARLFQKGTVYFVYVIGSTNGTNSYIKDYNIKISFTPPTEIEAE